jgi:hypothetical protein
MTKKLSDDTFVPRWFERPKVYLCYIGEWFGDSQIFSKSKQCMMIDDMNG